MTKHEQITSLVFQAIDDVNDQLMEDQRLEKSVKTIILGRQSALDSMAFVNLIVAVEDKIATVFDIEIMLANEQAFSEEESPFKTVESMINYIYRLLEENGAN